MNLTLYAITRELHEVEDAIISFLSNEDGLPHDQATSVIYELSQHVLYEPRSAAVLPLIARGWEGLRSLSSVVLAQSLISRVCRASIMYMDYAASHWLEVYIKAICAEILSPNLPDVNDWLTRLVQDVKLRLYCRSGEALVFKAAVYIPQLTTAAYTLHSARSRLPVESDKHDDVIISTVILILQNWLDYPTDPVAKQRAWFIHAVATEYGRAALYLDGVWEAYRALTGRAKQMGPWRVSTSFKSLRRDKHYTEMHPLSDPNSPESITLKDLADLLMGTQDNSHSIAQSKDSSNDDHSNIFVNCLSPQLKKLGRDEIHIFLSFVNDAINHQLQRDFQPANPALIQIIRDKPDKYNPFRELAPSRLRLKARGGPFSEELVRTTTGIFSAVVWRAITFGTKFAMEGPIVFTSSEDFGQKCSAMGKKKKTYFCDMSAYGSCNPKRRIENASIYWESLRDGMWEAFVGTREVAFKDCYDFFLCPKGRNLFPQLGPLTAYLLTADLSYSGVVEPPTLEEIAGTICDLDKGAANALRRMRLIPLKDHSSKDAYRQAVKSVYETVLNLIPSEKHSSLFVDFILIEHMLCKFSRSYDRLNRVPRTRDYPHA